MSSDLPHSSSNTHSFSCEHFFKIVDDSYLAKTPDNNTTDHNRTLRLMTKGECTDTVSSLIYVF